LAKIAENCDHNIDPRIGHDFATVGQKGSNLRPVFNESINADGLKAKLKVKFATTRK
jgi:hypothetical protein